MLAAHIALGDVRSSLGLDLELSACEVIKRELGTSTGVGFGDVVERGPVLERQQSSLLECQISS
eukprot:CAMPEP_0201638370 /NCGR_PEP_ID=MMETSP0493-20130528/16361_1 /ASSEMBLY_ACC=CAM_ASM_000838 /TAXON_ID=420259 /ORGANISM="Thalassiosira gravida, Strain GMp14c1" /LENGTH=63 /DNA_ID=CAMNT_0048111369 /DNA_START=82 /DNA_END=270 /DNA_ORIENTATION=-